MLLFTDAPGHGMMPTNSNEIPASDAYDVRHPSGLTIDTVMGTLLAKSIDLFFCSYAPSATCRTEEVLSQAYANHPDNMDSRELSVIDLAPTGTPGVTDPPGVGYNRHIIFVLDESGSMMNDWSGVVSAYNQYLGRRKQYQCTTDLVSVVQFSSASRITVNQQPIAAAPSSLSYGNGGTTFHPASLNACQLARSTPSTHVPVVVFMSDGCAGDSHLAAEEFSRLNTEIHNTKGHFLDLYVIAFGSGANVGQLGRIAGASPTGTVCSSADTNELTRVFVNIAGGNSQVIGLLENEIGKRVADAVSERISIEFFG